MIVSIIAVLVFFAVGVKAQEATPAPADNTDIVTTPETTDKASEATRITTLAKEFKLTEKTISDMRKSKMGWGEVEGALAIAKAISEKATADNPLTIEAALTEILAARESGMGWGNIAQKYGFKLGEIMRSDKAQKLEATGEKIQKTERIEKKEKIERAEKVERPEKPDKPEKAEKAQKSEKDEKPEKTEKGRP